MVVSFAREKGYFTGKMPISGFGYYAPLDYSALRICELPHVVIFPAKITGYGQNISAMWKEKPKNGCRCGLNRPANSTLRTTLCELRTELDLTKGCAAGPWSPAATVRSPLRWTVWSICTSGSMATPANRFYLCGSDAELVARLCGWNSLVPEGRRCQQRVRAGILQHRQSSTLFWWKEWSLLRYSPLRLSGHSMQWLISPTANTPGWWRISGNCSPELENGFYQMTASIDNKNHLTSWDGSGNSDELQQWCCRKTTAEWKKLGRIPACKIHGR